MKYPITNQKDIRKMFWDDYPDLSKRKWGNGDYCADTRMAFVDLIDSLQADGIISEALASRATL